MKNWKTVNDNLSVLNTDAFDRRRFKEIFAMSTSLQKLRKKSTVPMFEHLLADIWASFYKMKPEIKLEEIDYSLKVNQAIMERILADEQFSNYRRFTRLDDLSAAIGTVKFGEKTVEWLVGQQDEALQEKMLDIHLLQMRIFKEKQRESHEVQTLEEQRQEAMMEFNKKMQQLVEKNSFTFSQTLEQAITEIKEVKEGLKQLVGGSSAGKGDAELKKMPLRDQLLLAEKIATTKQLKEIADWAGRFKQIARKKKKQWQYDTIGRSGVTLGNNLERVLPMELALYMHTVTKKDFLRRFVEGETMQYEQKGHEKLGKGPIILCLDQSGSMQNLDSQSKGFTLALLSIARKQRRDFCLLLFSTHTQVFTYAKGKIASADILQLAQTFLGGGTDFTMPLKKAMCIINESRFKQADVVFITDGEDCVETPLLEAFNQNKKEKKFNVLSLVLGNSTKTVEPFSDKVVCVEAFDDEGSFVAFDL